MRFSPNIKCSADPLIENQYAILSFQWLTMVLPAFCWMEEAFETMTYVTITICGAAILFIYFSGIEKALRMSDSDNVTN